MLTRVDSRKDFTVNFICVLFYTWYSLNHLLKYILDKNICNKMQNFNIHVFDCGKG